VCLCHRGRGRLLRAARHHKIEGSWGRAPVHPSSSIRAASSRRPRRTQSVPFEARAARRHSDRRHRRGGPLRTALPRTRHRQHERRSLSPAAGPTDQLPDMPTTGKACTRHVTLPKGAGDATHVHAQLRFVPDGTSGLWVADREQGHLHVGRAPSGDVLEAARAALNPGVFHAGAVEPSPRSPTLRRERRRKTIRCCG
jgi:hypothetical protein